MLISISCYVHLIFKYKQHKNVNIANYTSIQGKLDLTTGFMETYFLHLLKLKSLEAEYLTAVSVSWYVYNRTSICTNMLCTILYK